MADERIKIILDAGMDISDVQANAKQIQNILKSFKMPAALSEDFEKQFKILETEITKIQTQMKAGFKTKGDITGLEKSTKTINTVFGTLKNLYSTFENEHLMMNVDFNTDEIKQARKDLADLQQQLKSKINTTEFTNLGEKIKEIGTLSKSSAVKNLKESFSSLDLSGVRTDLDSVVGGLTNFAKGNKDAVAAAKLFQDAWSNGKLDDIDDILTEMTPNMQKIAIAARDARKDLDALGNTDIGKLSNEVQKTTQHVRELENTQVDKVTQDTKELGQAFNQAGDHAEKCGNSIKDAANDMYSFNGQVEQVKNRVKDFFSLTNSVMLFRRGVQKAFEAVKELDAAMTETAVVTDFSVGDMWDQLPRYTAAANELGTTTLGAYETMTLFYQQGLETNEVFEIGTETMKMARIAGLDYADATDLMTAALRGFNMELNEASATRINDVYSELAAITAADTSEIANAMTKTASIAANANMEFETTAALLSQIIETTREPAETAGTAMKTIIARFTEMKKTSSEVINVDGEEVNVNKVEAALKSAGVALRDVNGEFRDLDDVFLELSSKWNGLDKMTQRYVATMAAGSRQQSRFIAMMQDYDRTLELVDAAYNSSGASQRQFEKTQDSLESKINRLKNAWNEFLMGISNSTVIKGAIDVLTGILNVVNKVTGAFGTGAGAILKMAAAYGALKVGAKASNKFFNNSTLINNMIRRSQGATAEQVETETVAKRKEQQQKARRTLNEKFGLYTGQLSNTTKQTHSAFLQAKNKKLDELSKVDTMDLILKTNVDEEIANTKAKIEALEQQLESEPFNIEVQTSLAEAEGELAALEMVQETNPIKKDVDADVALAELNLEAYENSEELDPIKKRIEIEKTKAVAELDAWEKKEEGDPIRKTVSANPNIQNNPFKKQSTFNWSSLKADTKNSIKTAGQNIKADAKQLGAKVFDAVKSKISSIVSSLGYLGPLLAGVLSTLAAIAAIWAASWYFSPIQTATREVENLSNAADKAAESVQHIKSALDGLKSGHSNLQQLKEELNDLVPGTDAYYAKIDEINNATNELLKNNPSLQLNAGVGPYAEINEKTYEDAVAELEKKEKNATGAQTMLNADLAVSKKNLAILEELDDLEKEVDTNNLVNGLWTAAGAVGGGIAGLLGGAILGAGSGAGVGALAGGIGAIPGAVIGAFGGAVTGLIGGGVSGGIAAHDKARENQAKKTEEYQERELMLQRELNAQKRSQDNAYKLAIAQGFGETVSDENKMAVSNALLSNLERRKEEEIDEIHKGSNKANKEEIAEWAERSGYTVKDKKVYDSEGNEVDISDKKAIAEQLAYMRALEKTQLDAAVVEGHLSSTSERLQQIMSGDLSTEFTEEQEQDLLKNYGEDGVSEIQKEFEKSLSGKSIADQKEILAAYLGIDPEEIDESQIDTYVDRVGTILEGKAAELLQQQKEQNAQLQTNMQTLVGGDLTGKGIFSQKISDKFGLEGMQQIQDFRDYLTETFDEDIARRITFSLVTNEADVNEITNVISKLQEIDLSNPIQGYKELNKLAKENNGLLGQTAEQLLNNSQYSTSGQFKHLYSELVSNEDLKSQLKEFMEDEQIDAGEISKLGVAYEDLNQFLKNTNMSASSLALTLTNLENGTIALEGLTSSVLNAVSHLSSFEDSLKTSAEAISNFEESLIDSMQNVDGLDSMTERLEEMMENREYGNLAVTQTIDFIYGKDALKSVENDTQKYIEFLKSKQEEISRWDAHGGMGFFQDLANDKNYSQVYYGQNGAINFDIGSMTENEIITSLAQAKNISEEAARIYWEAYVSHSPDAQRKVNENNIEAAKNSFLQDKINQSNTSSLGNGTLTATKKEFEALAKQLGIEYDELLKDLQARSKDFKIIDTDNLENIDGKGLAQKILDESGLDSDGIALKFSVGTENGKNIIDAEALKQEIMQVYGYSESQAEQAVDNIAAQAGAVVGAFYQSVDENGNPIQKWVTGANMSEVTNKLDSALGNTQSFADLLADQNYEQIGTILSNILQQTAKKFASSLLNDALVNVLAAVLYVGDRTVAGGNPRGWEATKQSVRDMLTSGTGNTGGGTGDNNKNNFESGKESQGYVGMGETTAGYLKDWGISIPTNAKIMGKNGQVQYIKDPETGAYYSVLSSTYTWEDEKEQERSYTHNWHHYYDANGKEISKEEYDKIVGRKTTTTSYVPSTNEDDDDDDKGDKGESLNIEKESDKIKAKIDEIDSAIKDLADNDIVDMRMVNELINQKIALQKQYKKALEQELGLLSKSTDEIWSQVKKAGNDKYIQYDEETGMYGYTDAYYDEFYEDGLPIDSEQMQKIQEQASQLNKVNSDQLANQVAIKELVDNLVENQAENYNAERSLKGRERRQTEADAEEELIGMLPEEIQPFFQALNTAEDARLEMQEIQANKVLAENLQQQLDASYAGVPDYIKENMTFDEYSGYGIDLAKINQIEDKEAREEMLTAVQENAKILNEQYFDPLYDVKEQLSGGKLQRGILNAGKALTNFAKEIRDGKIDNGFLKINTGFEALDDALNGLAEKLEDSAFLEKILKTKITPDLHLTDEQIGKIIENDQFMSALSKSGWGQFVLNAISGGASTKDFLSGVTGSLGKALEGIGGFLNFDMMKILGDSGGLIEQGKQIVEQIVGKVAEVTGALIDAWTNREDILYNFLNVLEKYLHDYEVMQRYSTQLEKGRMASVDDIRQNWEQQWQSLQDQLEMQQERIETRQDQLNRSRWNPFQLISGWNPETDSLYENREIKMAFDLLISAIGMLPMGLGAFGGQLNQLYEDYDKRVQEAYEDRLGAEMAILDIEDERLELVKIGAEEATEFEQKVLDALVQKEQEQIDELSRLNDAITDANSKLISTLQKNLDQIRQDRENEKKEEELGEKERRLAYLRQDTSGANMMEIKKLEEELEEGHEDYTDTLIDQKISELEKQNEAAAEQRQQQIDLLQAQLDWSQKYGLYWDAIYGMLYTIDENGNAVLNPENFDLDGNIRENSQLAQMLGTFSDRLGMSVWSSVLDNEEAKRLGRYYGAFIGNNGVTGEWADYWALLNPGADDPDYATPDPDIPEGILGVLWNIESSLRNYFIKSDGALFDGFGHMGEKIANGLGDLLGIDSLSNYDYITNSKRTDQAPLTEMLVNGGEKMVEGWMNILSRGNKTTQGLSRTENNGVETMNIHFNIGNVGENISLDDMVDKVTVAFKEMFAGKTNLLKVGH